MTDERSAPRRRSLLAESAILDAAAALLREEGWAGFSIDALARRARVGKPTIYRLWPKRSGLLAALYAREGAARLPDIDTGRLADDLDGIGRALAEGWAASAAGEALRGLLAEAAQGEAERAVLRGVLDAALTRPLTAAFGRAVRRREAEAADAEAVVELWSGLLLARLLAGPPPEGRSGAARAARLLATGRGRKGGKGG